MVLKYMEWNFRFVYKYILCVCVCARREMETLVSRESKIQTERGVNLKSSGY